MKKYTYNMSENSKKKLTIDMSKVDSPITIDFINDTSGQVWITRNGNTATITGYAMKTVKKATVHLYAKADIYTYPTYQYNVVSYETDPWEWEKIQTSDATHQVQWGHYEYIDNDGYFGGWDFWSPDVSITSMQETEATIANDECQKSTITYYTGDKYGKNLKEIGKKVFDWAEVPEEGTLRDYRNPIISIVDAVDYFPGNLTNYQGGGSVVDYSRKYVQITITNIDKYNGNGIIVNTENGKYNNYNLFDVYEVEGNKKNKFSGTNFDEEFNGTTSADKIYTGGGTDTVDAGKGNDKIYISGKGDKTITINKGDGNDIIYTVQKADSVALDYDTDNLFYSKSGNNLIITRAYGDNSVEGTAISGFFKKKPSNIYVSGEDKDIMSQINDTDIRLTLTSEKKKITGSAYSDQIYGGDNTTTINAKNGNNWIVTSANSKKAMNLSAGTGNDMYFIQNLQNKIVISDKGGTSDSIIIADQNYAYNDIFVFYDIKLDKKKIYTTETSQHFLSIDNNDATDIKSRKGKISDRIVVKNAMTKNADGDKGWIEGVAFVDGENLIELETDWANLEQSVVGWLSENGFKSSMAVFKSAGEDKVNELLQIYISNTSVVS